MSMELIKKAVASCMKQGIPDFRIGDTVDVACRIVEGEKERVQTFTGTVISRRGSGMSEMFTVRRIVNNEGVERVFPIHSPKVASISVVRGGKVRRAKLYYLQQRVGKSRRLKEIEKGHVTIPGEEAPAQSAEPVAAAAPAAPAAEQPKA